MVLDGLNEIFARGGDAPSPGSWLGEDDPMWGRHHQAGSSTSGHNATEIGWAESEQAVSLVHYVRAGQTAGYRDAVSFLRLLAQEPGKVWASTDLEAHLEARLASGALNVLGRGMVQVFGTKDATDPRCRAYPWKWWQSAEIGSVYAMRPTVAVVLGAAGLFASSSAEEKQVGVQVYRGPG